MCTGKVWKKKNHALASLLNGFKWSKMHIILYRTHLVTLFNVRNDPGNHVQGIYFIVTMCSNVFIYFLNCQLIWRSQEAFSTCYSPQFILNAAVFMRPIMEVKVVVQRWPDLLSPRWRHWLIVEIFLVWTVLFMHDSLLYIACPTQVMS